MFVQEVVYTHLFCLTVLESKKVQGSFFFVVGGGVCLLSACLEARPIGICVFVFVFCDSTVAVEMQQQECNEGKEFIEKIVATKGCVPWSDVISVPGRVWLLCLLCLLCLLLRLTFYLVGLLMRLICC